MGLCVASSTTCTLPDIYCHIILSIKHIHYKQVTQNHNALTLNCIYVVRNILAQLALQVSPSH